MNDKMVFEFIKHASLNNNEQFRRSYQDIKKGLVKQGEETEDHKKLALFLAAKKFLKQSVLIPSDTQARANTPGTVGANMPPQSPVAGGLMGAMTSPPMNAPAPIPSINPAPNLKPPQKINKSDIAKTTGNQPKAVTMQTSGKTVTGGWTRW